MPTVDYLTTHAPGPARSTACGHPYHPFRKVANDPFTFLQCASRKPRRTCPECVQVLRANPVLARTFATLFQTLTP